MISIGSFENFVKYNETQCYWFPVGHVQNSQPGRSESEIVVNYKLIATWKCYQGKSKFNDLDTLKFDRS